MIGVRGLRARFGAFELGPLDFEAPEGAYIALVGPSGHGKTSLLWALAGGAAAQGELRVGDRYWSGLPPEKRSAALVPQGGLLFPHLSVAGNIGYACGNKAGRVSALAKDWGISHLLERRPSSLSGGEAMRVAIARALAREPALLLLDEPLSAIDEAGRAPLLTKLRGLRGTRTVVHVTHDLDEAAALASHLGVLREGKLAAFGTVDEVLLRPPTPAVAAFLGAENLLAGEFVLHGDDASLFRVGGLELHVLARASGEGYVSIPERAVMISLEPPHEVSARNLIAATVADIVLDRSGARVELSGAVRLHARLERQSVAALGLAPGKSVFAMVKSAQIRVVAADR